MVMQPASDDPRGEATRQQLISAYLELLDEQGAATPGEIAERAEVNRSSFYAHFPSIEALVSFALRREIDLQHRRNLQSQLDDVTAAPLANRQIIDVILDMVSATSGPMLPLLNADPRFGQWALGAILHDFVDEYLDALPAFSTLSDTRARITSSYVGHALSAVIVSWLLGDVAIDRAAVGTMLAQLTPAWIMDPSLVEAAS
ncbi:MAG: TetR/AcrR family transcriptional regulator [Actinobacteria bacterium]|nr:TetR/AcrR family transcriptional regulator [Actinomycetota bacterium]